MKTRMGKHHVWFGNLVEMVVRAVLYLCSEKHEELLASTAQTGVRLPPLHEIAGPLGHYYLTNVVEGRLLVFSLAERI